jgi:hypothetical protein
VRRRINFHHLADCSFRVHGHSDRHGCGVAEWKSFDQTTIGAPADGCVSTMALAVGVSAVPVRSALSFILDAYGGIHVADGSWLCENSKIEFACRSFRLDFVGLKTNNAGDCFLQETTEKTILRIPRARTFLHSLGH